MSPTTGCALGEEACFTRSRGGMSHQGEASPCAMFAPVDGSSPSTEAASPYRGADFVRQRMPRNRFQNGLCVQQVCPFKERDRGGGRAFEYTRVTITELG
jgi:hypothetical protein